ncbi:MAG: D-alanyl-D-alanine carboxypeptidase [Clostridiales bacterium]|nr:D-alanyl-D-alanine carboxypeptidase [Clostridiales bacterium]
MKKRKIFSQMALPGLLALLLTMTCPVWAAAVDNTAVYTITTNEIQGWPQGPEISSDTAVLMDADSGLVLYSKGGDERRYPASITKVMTLLLAVENASLEDSVTFSDSAVSNITADSSNIGMQVGEVMSMEDCLYALVLKSANEVATQIAEYVGGTEEAFIQMMNDRAAELGCTDTHFVNANGMPDDNHYTTAHDMARIMQAGLANETFREIIGSTDYTILPTNLNSEARLLHTDHPLMAVESGYYYEGCIGGKTGNTTVAGRTLITAAEKNGVTLIAVTLRASDLTVSCTDTTALLNYGYESFEEIQVEGGSVLVPAGVSVEELSTLEETDGDGAAVLNYYYGDFLVGTGSVPVISTSGEAVETEDAGSEDALETVSGEVTSETGSSGETDAAEEEEESEGTLRSLRPVLLVLLAVMVVVLAVLAALLIKRKRK